MTLAVLRLVLHRTAIGLVVRAGIENAGVQAGGIVRRRTPDAGGRARTYQGCADHPADEPFEGLAPLIVRNLVHISRELAAQGRTIVVVEQNAVAALSFADRLYVLNNDHVVWEGTPAELHARLEIMHSHLGI